MSEIKTKKFEYRKVVGGGRNFGKYAKRVDDKGLNVEPERNTQKTTDESDYEQRRVNSLLHIIFKICELSGFWVEERIVLKDRKTGKIWR